ncbi:MAG: putative membrane protein YfcA [Colwellia polaris]
MFDEMLDLILIGFIAVFLGGLTKGVTGFGYAVTGTALLASFIPAKTAVIIMLPALLATNIDIVHKYGFKEIWTRIKDFRFFAVSLIAGSVAGTLMIAALPQNIIEIGVGSVTLIYVLSKQELAEIDLFRGFKKFCLKKSHEYQGLLGLSAGLVFGSSNVGVPIVAVAQRIENNHESFVALLSGLMIASITSRFITAYAVGLYRFDSFFTGMLLLVPGLFGLEVGEKIRGKLDEDIIRGSVTVLLVLIGIKLVFF